MARMATRGHGAGATFQPASGLAGADGEASPGGVRPATTPGTRAAFDLLLGARVALSWSSPERRTSALHHHTLTTRERVLGPDHPDTLTSRNNLAITLRAARATRNRWWPFRRT